MKHYKDNAHINNQKGVGDQATRIMQKGKDRSSISSSSFY